jgi:hypothetical protein
MALTEESVIDTINVKPNGAMEVRRADRILRDGVEISKAYNRHVVAPGDDLSREDTRVQEIGAVVHTAEVIAAYRASLL